VSDDEEEKQGTEDDEAGVSGVGGRAGSGGWGTGRPVRTCTQQVLARSVLIVYVPSKSLTWSLNPQCDQVISLVGRVGCVRERTSLCVCVVENDRWGMTTKLVFHRPTAITVRRSRTITVMLFENNNNNDLKKIYK